MPCRSAFSTALADRHSQRLYPHEDEYDQENVADNMRCKRRFHVAMGEVRTALNNDEQPPLDNQKMGETRTENGKRKADDLYQHARTNTNYFQASEN